ncbi:rod shape-determining protein MreC [Daejeonella sp.]|jgi:rod shape-determining protein MreC|uniref:rod shape-determining protein MreC n=1 Tax=Daejeonella sp. TaxID=2805397 RepID=UPI003783A459
MRNIWLLFSKYNAFFLLIIYFLISLILLIKNNSYQRASVWNSSNKIIGETYDQVNELKSYLSLGRTNDSLAAENALLRNQLSSSFKSDSIKKVTVRDSTIKQQYTYTLAKVINNSINRKNNYLTIDRGTKHGIVKGMGVTSAKGIVGIVWNVSENFATIRSILHSDTKVSAQVNGNIGSLVWGEGNNDSRYVYLKDVQTHLTIKKGDKVLSSEFSLFPEGTNIGYVVENRIKGGANDTEIKVKLSTDFSTLQYQYVYVINNLLATEQQSLESQNKIE